MERDKNTITNFEPKSAEDPQPTDTTSQRETEKPRIREWFPETWYWNPVLITDKNGEASVSLTTPDSITTWEIKAVGSTQNAKIGVTNENLTVFQQFFIEPDIPVSVVRNDTFPLRTTPTRTYPRPRRTRTRSTSAAAGPPPSTGWCSTRLGPAPYPGAARPTCPTITAETATTIPREGSLRCSRT